MFSKRTIGNFAASAYGAAVALFVMMSIPSGPVRADVISQNPLSVGGDVPGNVALALSVEFPTAVSVAHQGNFTSNTAYVGYFDHYKCYRYVQASSLSTVHDSSTTGDNVSYFTPVGEANNDYSCTGSLDNAWSGTFLNWLTMQAIDPFRQALTGGYRRVDTSSGLTILERAWSPTFNEGGNNQGSDTNFPPIPTSDSDVLKRRQSPSSAQIAAHTPFTWSSMKASVRMRGNQVLISSGGSGSPTLHSTEPSNASPPGSGITHYSQSLTPNTTTIYRFYARVRVCDTISGTWRLESNCKRYGSYYKPEGLIQEYSRRLRFSALGYLNDPTDDPRDGGVLRARQKFVGPEVIVPGSTPVNNANKEWDPATGVFISNPDSADATATQSAYSGVTVNNSGVINYLNKFGQTNHVYKRRDPVGELYYAALRYLKNQGNVSAWMPGTSDTNRARLIDGFPVISNWSPDPIQYACQRNYIVGIGDTNSSWDRNVPGSTNDGQISHNPPGGKPAAVTNDTTVDAAAMRDKVKALNGGLSGASGDASDLIAGLAYHAATQDIRPDLANLSNQPRGQNVRTYWLDVLEFAEYTANNQYYLATKYGGLKIPNNVTFNPLTASAADIPESWWRTNTDTVGSQPRPDNYYTVADPDAMVRGLRKTFVSIVNDQVGSSSSLAANSTRLDLDTITFQAQFRSGVWSGELNAYSVDANGELSANPIWSATEDMLTGITGTPGPWAGRKILAANDTGDALVNFTTGTGGLSSTQKAYFGATAAAQTNVVNYLRGERTNEDSQDNGFLRTRESILGDIVNSTPLFVGAPNAALHAGKSYAGGADYAAWVNTVKTRAPIVYVGANDGMLHAFHATTGKEIFAFIPNKAIVNGLADVSNPLYEHKYFVDGETAAADIYDGSDWKTVLVGSMGRGGPGIFALDVTDPDAPALLWELDGTDIPQLGRNIGRPVIAQVADGDWRVLLGNGPDSGAGAQLISIPLETSPTVSVFSLDSTAENGLTALLVRDSDANSFADVAYAGDLEGSLWKVTALGTGSPAAVQLFSAVGPDSNVQPITAAPMVARDPATAQLWVFFGTGRYMHENDINNKEVQSWYGVVDNGTTVTRGDLVDRDILVEVTISGIPARVIEDGSAADLVGKKGWYIDLVSPTVNPADGKRGERMVVQNRFQGQALIGTTRIPEFTDPCDPGGTGYIMAINPFTGARLSTTFFDLNGDGISNDSDKYCNAGTCVPISGLAFQSSPNNPIFIENVMQVGLDSGETETIETFGSSVEATRMSWRELFNN